MSSSSSSYTILLFAAARDLLGSSRVSVSCSDLTEFLSSEPSKPVQLCNLCSFLISRYPDIKEIFSHSLMAVNGSYAEPNSDQVIEPSDEIALIPPISGG
jgi:molybdopterin converting factor small subunit